eukprot:360398-Chlamydomonas_euryale.AAC.1
MHTHPNLCSHLPTSPHPLPRPAPLQSLGDDLLESLSVDNIPIFTEQEKYNQCVESVVDRIRAQLNGNEVPGRWPEGGGGQAATRCWVGGLKTGEGHGSKKVLGRRPEDKGRPWQQEGAW